MGNLISYIGGGNLVFVWLNVYFLQVGRLRCEQNLCEVVLFMWKDREFVVVMGDEDDNIQFFIVVKIK